MKQPKTKRLKRRKSSLFRRFIKYVIFCLSIATMHGVIHIVRRRRLLLERVFWIAIVASSVAAVAVQTVRIWDRYTKNPVIVTVDKDYSRWKIPFASVIVCQTEPSLKAKKYLTNMSQQLNFSKAALTEYFNDLTFSTYYTYKNLEKYANGSVRELLSTGKYIEVISEWASRMEYKKRIFDPITHPLDNELPIHFVLTELGPCDYYHSKIAEFINVTNMNLWNVTSHFKPSLKNYTSGNVILSFSDIIKKPYKLYLAYFNEIVDITSRPAFEVGRIEVMELDYDISEVDSDESLHGMTPQQRNCKFTSEADYIDHNVVYSYKICRMECRIKLCLKWCHCTPVYYKRSHNEPICNLTGLYCLSEYSEILISLENGTEKLCSCYQNCNTGNIMGTRSPGVDWDIRPILKVGFKTFPTTRYIRTQVYTGSDVLVQIGGLLGFFLGASLLSLVEIGYFATLRFFWAVFGRKQIEADL